MSHKTSLIVTFLALLTACGSSQNVPERTEQVPDAVQAVSPSPVATITVDQDANETVAPPPVQPSAPIIATPLPTVSPSPEPVATATPVPTPTPTPEVSATPVSTPTPSTTPISNPVTIAQPVPIATIAPQPVVSPTPINTVISPPYDYSLPGVTWVLGNCEPLHAALLQFQRDPGGTYSVIGAPDDSVLIRADPNHNFTHMGQILLTFPYEGTTISVGCDDTGTCGGISTLQGTPICHTPTIAPAD